MCGSASRSASASRAARRSSSRGRSTGRRGRRPPQRWHDLDATAIVVHTSGSSGRPKPVELTYGNWLWSALGSCAALGLDPDGALALRAAALATSAGSRSSCAARSRRPPRSSTSASTPSACSSTLERPERRDARLARADDAAAPARRRAARAAGACAGRCVGGAPVTPALVGRAAAHAVPVATTYGMTEACSQVTTSRRAAVLHGRPPRRDGRRDPRAAARRSRPARAPVLAHRRPRRARRATGACTSPGARRTRS